MGLEACAIRLKAARLASSMSQIELAAALGYDRSTNISNMETGKNHPNREVMSWLWREKRIDFNFLMAGLYAQLPGDVQDRLFPALEAATSEWDQREGSGQSPAAQRQSQSQK